MTIHASLKRSWAPPTTLTASSFARTATSRVKSSVLRLLRKRAIVPLPPNSAALVFPAAERPFLALPPPLPVDEGERTCEPSLVADDEATEPRADDEGLPVPPANESVSGSSDESASESAVSGLDATRFSGSALQRPSKVGFVRTEEFERISLEMSFSTGGRDSVRAHSGLRERERGLTVAPQRAGGHGQAEPERDLFELALSFRVEGTCKQTQLETS